MKEESRVHKYLCFSCGYEERKMGVVLTRSLPGGKREVRIAKTVKFRKCPKCGRPNLAFHRLLPKQGLSGESPRCKKSEC